MYKLTIYIYSIISIPHITEVIGGLGIIDYNVGVFYYMFVYNV